MTRRQPARKRALAVLLLLACLLGAGLLALQREYPDLMVRRLSLEGESPSARTPANGPGTGQPAAGRPNSPPPESRFAVISLRPLFTAGRRPPDRPDATGAVVPGGPPTDLLVTGIVMAGEDSAAIIEPARPGPQAEPALVVRVGDSVSGWMVAEIEAGRVILERDGERYEMQLRDEKDTRRGTAPPRRAATPRRAPVANQPRQAPITPQPQPRQIPITPQPQPRQIPITPQPQPQPQPPPTQKIPN